MFYFIGVQIKEKDAVFVSTDLCFTSSSCFDEEERTVASHAYEASFRVESLDAIMLMIKICQA